MNTLPTVNIDPSKIVKIGIAFELTKKQYTNTCDQSHTNESRNNHCFRILFTDKHLQNQ